MFHSVIFSRAILLMATILLYMHIGGKTSKSSLRPRVFTGVIQMNSPATNEKVQHVRKSNSESFYAKSPTVCSWIGGSSGNWEDAASWSCSHVPTVENDVEIFVGTVTLNSIAQVNSLIVGNGAGLIVASGKTITVYH